MEIQSVAIGISLIAIFLAIYLDAKSKIIDEVHSYKRELPKLLNIDQFKKNSDESTTGTVLIESKSSIGYEFSDLVKNENSIIFITDLNGNIMMGNSSFNKSINKDLIKNVYDLFPERQFKFYLKKREGRSGSLTVESVKFNHLDNSVKNSNFTRYNGNFFYIYRLETNVKEKEHG